MKPKGMAKLLGAMVASIAAMAMFAGVAQAEVPAPPYTQFAGCPNKAEDPLVKSCSRSIINSGHFQMGSKDVPITTPITLTGGARESGALVANAEGGLSASKQQVPGGIIGITGLDWLVNFLNIEQLKLYAVTELAGQPFLVGGNLTLPIKVHLINSALGSKCYVGSVTEPISLNLTTGATAPPPPNEPITGKAPKVVFDPVTKILHFNGGTYVDNSFAAPGANGCVLTLFGIIPVSLNGLVNSMSGLPSPAGTNETEQNFDLESASQKFVYNGK